MKWQGRPLRALRALADHPDGLPTPQIARVLGEEAQPWQQALTRVGNAVRTLEESGLAERAGKVPGTWQRGPATVWRITEAGVALLTVPQLAAAPAPRRYQTAGRCPECTRYVAGKPSGQGGVQLRPHKGADGSACRRGSGSVVPVAVRPSPGHLWDRAIRDADEHAPGSMEEAVRSELAALWYDLDHARSYAINGSWSMACDDIAARIIILSRLTSATPWGEVPMTLLLDGTYQGLLESAGIGFDPPDMGEVRELEARRA